jgi:hypothetical protein
MSEITERLLADMRWRLSPAGGRFRPSRREAESWGATTLTWPGKLLAGCLLQSAAMAGLVATIHVIEWLGVLLMFLMFLSIPLAFWMGGKVQRRLDFTAYRRMIGENERFALVEYGRLLKRHIDMAQRDPALGGPAEVQRLTELHGRLQEMLKKGAGEALYQRSPLGSEADLAEAVLESYDIGSDDAQQLADLDQRLPEELRSRLADLDREVGQKPTKTRE